MRKPYGQIALVVATIALLYLSLARCVPLPVQDVLFTMLVVLLPALNVWGWWALKRMNQDEATARWRKLAALLGLVANSLAIALPFAAVLYGVYIDHLKGRINGSDILDTSFALRAALAFGAFGLVAGTIAPSRIRLSLMLGGFGTCLVILSIPIGVL
jgi:hypothetical protein